MKIVIFISAMTFFCSRAAAQRYDSTNVPKRMAMAGKELLKFRSEYSTGTTLIMVGAACSAAAAVSDAKSNGAIIGIGAGISVIGAIMTIAAHAHIGKAGMYLRGNSIVLPIK